MPSTITPTSLVELAAQCDDAQWLDALKEASIGPIVRGVRFSAPPDPKWQSNFVGMSGANALVDASGFYQFVKAEYQGHTGNAVGTGTRVLDFGSGWGRFLLFFMKDVAAGNLFGVDVDPDVIGFCKVSGLPAKLCYGASLRPHLFWAELPRSHILIFGFFTSCGAGASGVDFMSLGGS